ncbi:hypothetical protein, partial [Holospora obtusa]|uniref:hypothetical protein n=1 Tax=Holospora obtusa TaxID=49893 RepID=UPI0019554881
YQEDPVSFFVLKNLQTKNMIISSRNQLLLRNISYYLKNVPVTVSKIILLRRHRVGIKTHKVHTCIKLSYRFQKK